MTVRIREGCTCIEENACSTHCDRFHRKSLLLFPILPRKLASSYTLRNVIVDNFFLFATFVCRALFQAFLARETFMTVHLCFLICHTTLTFFVRDHASPNRGTKIIPLRGIFNPSSFISRKKKVSFCQYDRAYSTKKMEWKTLFRPYSVPSSSLYWQEI